MPDVCGWVKMLDVYHNIFHFEISKDGEAIHCDDRLSYNVRLITCCSSDVFKSCTFYNQKTGSYSTLGFTRVVRLPPVVLLGNWTPIFSVCIHPRSHIS